MENSFLNSRRFVSFVIFFYLLAGGCGARPDIVSSRPAPGKKYSDAEVREITVDQPFLVSGDYFREREYIAVDEPDMGAAKKDDSTNKQENIAKQASPATEPAKKSSSAGSAALYATAAQGPAFGAKDGLKIKVGILVDRKAVSLVNENRLITSMVSLSQSYAVVPVLPDEISEHLSNSNCIAKSDMSCAARVISVFPGVRMLALVKEFSLPESIPAMAKAKVTIVDTGLPVSYPPMEIQMQIKEKDAVDSFANSVLSTVFEKALKRSRIMPWFCRTFSTKANTWFINAGRSSGLKTGDMLRIVSKGELVKTPAGLPAGWIPGNEGGTLKIDKLFGNDLAACSLVKGQGPSREDMLVK